MFRPSPVRGLLLFLSPILASPILAVSAQSTLPATAPTNSPAPQVAAPTAAPSPAHRAEVRFDSGLITINAQNASLNQILREISRLTGMKITGTVREERVFGHYGPAQPAVILATLLDGTHTNMLLRQGPSALPVELVLTPRTGGPTPSSAFNGSRSARDEDEGQPASLPIAAPGQPGYGQQPTGPQPIPPPRNNPLGSPTNTTPTASQIPTTNSVPLDSVSTPNTARPPQQGIVDSANPVPPGTVNPVVDSATSAGSAAGSNTNTTTSPNPAGSNPPAPNGVKTPEEIYQQLQQLRQQQKPPESSPTPPQH